MSLLLGNKHLPNSGTATGSRGGRGGVGVLPYKKYGGARREILIP